MHSLTEAEFEACVNAAVKAPSIHNTQPWLFFRGPEGIEVYADLARRLPAIDAEGRAMHISLGGAVLNIRIALAHGGWDSHTVLLPDPDDSRHVATVRAEGPRPVGPDDRELFAARTTASCSRRSSGGTATAVPSRTWPRRSQR